MSCEAKTYSDGSWYCGRCSMAGDQDETPECKTSKQIGEDALANIKKEVQQYR